MKANLKEMYFKWQDLLPFEKYVNCLKECYNTLENLVQPEFEVKKVWTLLYCTNFSDEQVNACVYTSSKFHKDNFSGACTYLASKVTRISPIKIQNRSDSSRMEISREN